MKTAAGETILLRGGTYFDFIDPWNSDFTIEDVAHGLSNVCRFAGQSRQFYSVAEHSVEVAQLVPPQFALAALLHDASEAFIGDVTRPLKAMLPDYRAIENQVQEAVELRLRGTFGGTETQRLAIKRADLVMLATEQAQLMPAHDDDWAVLAGVEPLPHHTCLCLPPESAREFFLTAWRALSATTAAPEFPTSDERPHHA